MRNGFGLVEVLIALFILTAAFGPLVTMVQQGRRTVRWTELETQTVLAAASILDREAARPFEKIENDQELEENTTDGGEQRLERIHESAGLIVLRVTLTFALSGNGKQPRHTVTLERVIARPDASFAVALPTTGVS